MNKVRASVGILAVTAAAVCAMAAASPAERPARVEITTVEPACVEQVLALAGQVRYEAEFAAVAPATGVAAQVYVRPGDWVEAGQALLRMEDQGMSEAVSAMLGGSADLAEALQAESMDAQALQAASQLELLTVRAPAAGVVRGVNVAQHGGVLAGEPAVLLSGREQVILCAAVLRDAKRLRAGLPARIVSEGGSVAAVVREIGPAQADASTGQTVCQVTLALRETLDLPAGARVEAEVILARGESVPALPACAVSDEGTVLWAAQGHCYEIPVQVLLESDELCWVDLPVGTAVITGGEAAEHGRRVEVEQR